MVILVSGTPVTGFEFLGPFPDLEAAEGYASTDRGCRDNPWWVAVLESPDPAALKDAIYPEEAE
jgi:hypothetical protein